MESMERSTGNPFAPVRTKRASEAIYEQIRTLIIRGELKPGDRLPNEQSMIDLFQRSRPTIREALRMLEHSGYIKATAGSNGAVILEPNDKNVEQSVEDVLQLGQITLEEMSEYRKAGEVAAAGWAAQRRTQEDLDAMEALLAQMDACTDDYEAFIDMDPQFHDLLAKAAKNTISAVMNRTLSRINRSFMKEKMRKLTPEERITMSKKIHGMHTDIYLAIREGDTDKARQAMDSHLSAFETDLRDSL